MNVAEFMRICHELEVDLASIYRSLQNKGELNNDVRTVFADLEQSGTLIANRLQGDWSRLVFQTCLPADPVFPGLLAKNLEKNRRALDSQAHSEFQALCLVKDLEMRFWDFHLHNALHFDQVEIKSLFIDISRTKRENITRLGECILAASAQPAIRSRLA